MNPHARHRKWLGYKKTHDLQTWEWTGRKVSFKDISMKSGVRMCLLRCFKWWKGTLVNGSVRDKSQTGLNTSVLWHMYVRTCVSRPDQWDVKFGSVTCQLNYMSFQFSDMSTLFYDSVNFSDTCTNIRLTMCQDDYNNMPRSAQLNSLYHHRGACRILFLPIWGRTVDTEYILTQSSIAIHLTPSHLHSHTQWWLLSAVHMCVNQPYCGMTSLQKPTDCFQLNRVRVTTPVCVVDLLHTPPCVKFTQALNKMELCIHWKHEGMLQRWTPNTVYRFRGEHCLLGGDGRSDLPPSNRDSGNLQRTSIFTKLIHTYLAISPTLPLLLCVQCFGSTRGCRGSDSAQAEKCCTQNNSRILHQCWNWKRDNFILKIRSCMVGQFLSKHVAVKQVEGKTF